MDAGTSCATPTIPTSKIIVAIIISRMLKPSWPLRTIVYERRMSISYSWTLADLPPNSSWRGGPYLRASGRKQDHRAKPIFGMGRAADVEHISLQGRKRAPGIKQDAAVGAG